MSDDLTPEHPEAEGIDPTYPDQTRQEGTHLLANQARDVLQGEGFSDEQVFEWAAAYVEREGGGTVEDLVAWIRAKESS